MLKQLILFWLLTLFTYANHVHWLGDYDKALQRAHQEHKPLLVLVVRHKDPFSHSIIKKYFMNHAYVDSINQKMIAVIVTYDGSVSYPIEMYYTTVFPTLFWVDTRSETFMKEPLYGSEIKSDMLKKIISHIHL